MTGTTTSNRKWPRPVWLLAAAIAAVMAANAHLVFVAVTSDPGCVAHLKEKGDRPGQYRAAKSAC